MEKGAMNDAVKRELLRQSGFQRKATGAYEQSLGQSTPQAAQKQLGQGQQQALAEYQKVQAVPLSVSSPVQPGAKDQITQSSRNNAYSDLMAKRNAENQGYGNFGLQQYLKDLTANQQIGAIGNMAGRSQGILPYEVQAASQSWGGLHALGTALQAAGSLAGIYNGINAGSSGLAGTGFSQSNIPANFSAAPLASAGDATLGGAAAVSPWASTSWLPLGQTASMVQPWYTKPLGYMQGF